MLSLGHKQYNSAAAEQLIHNKIILGSISKPHLADN